jgi:hypothetical protein
MKMLIFSAMLFIAASSFTTPIKIRTVSTTTTGSFDFFRAHRQGKHSVLTWSVSTPDVAQFEIERSYDGQYFNDINIIPGSVGTVTYKDETVFPGYIYYRITAHKTDGSTETSSVEVVHIVAH